jgi:acetyl esterase
MTTHESLHPELVGLVEVLDAAPPITELPVGVLRQLIREQWFDANAPTEIETRNLSIPVDGHTIAARLYIPANASAITPGVIFFHGGGFVFGDLDSHDGACRRLCRSSGVRILAVDYRLAPEHRMPAAHDDAEAAVRWVFNHTAQLGFDSNRIGLCGDSAGGLLAASTAFVLRSDPLCRIKSQTLIYPVLMFSGSTPSRQTFAAGPILSASVIEHFSESYLGSGSSGSDDVRLNLLTADLTGMPPTTLVIAGLDPLQDEARSFARALTECGVPTSVTELGSLPHGFLTLSHVSPAVGQVVAQIGTNLGGAL